MKISFLELRRNPRKILEAIERDETVTLSKRGREIAYIVPKKAKSFDACVRSTSAFGIWKDRSDMKDPAEYVRKVRKGRFNDI